MDSHLYDLSDEHSRASWGEGVGRNWVKVARRNESEWGIQHPEELLSAIVEEVGEIEQAYLEATHEDGYVEAAEAEIDDLGPLLFQLQRSLREHPQSFEPLPTAGEVNDA